MTWTDHTHREYADTSHRHGFYDLHDVAREHHSHHDTESEVRGLREDLSQALGRIRDLEDRQAALLRALREAAVLHEARQRTGLADEAYLPVSEELFELLDGLAVALAGEDDEAEPEECDPGPEAEAAAEYRRLFAAPPREVF